MESHIDHKPQRETMAKHTRIVPEIPIILRGHYTAYGNGNIGLAYHKLVSLLATYSQSKCAWDGHVLDV